jgi:hypothetical protein
LRKHIEDYYKQMFRREERGRLRLERDFWEVEGSLSADEASTLIESFTEKEIKDTLVDMKSNIALGPDGPPVEFYKCFWEQAKSHALEMFEKLHKRGIKLKQDELWADILDP